MNFDFYDNYKTRLYIPLLNIDFELEDINFEYTIKFNDNKTVGEDVNSDYLGMTFFINANSREDKIKMVYTHRLRNNGYDEHL